MNKQEILEAYRFRHACKEFDPAREVSREDMDFILETGRLSPSSFGFEPWQMVVVQNPELRLKLLPVTWGGQKALPTASHLVLLLARESRHLLPQSEYIRYMYGEVRGVPADKLDGALGRYGAFLERDFGLLGNDRAMFEWACRQTYIALGNMMTAAAQIGIDSLPIEGFQKQECEQLLREEGLLPEGLGLACMLAFGYRIADGRPKTRRCTDEVIRWVE